MTLRFNRRVFVHVLEPWSEAESVMLWLLPPIIAWWGKQSHSLVYIGVGGCIP